MSSTKKRSQITEILKISVSPARCSYYIKQFIDNKPDKKEIRINSEVINVTAVLCNNVIEEILKNIINEMIESKKKNIDSSIISASNYKNNIYYPIYYRLPSFNNFDFKYYESNKKHKKNLKTIDKEEIKVEEVKVNDEIEIDNDIDNEKIINVNKNTFNIYIDLIFKNIKKSLNDNDFVSKIRITSDAKEYLSNLIIGIIQNLITLSKIIIYQIQSIKTINTNYIKTVLILMMKNELYSNDIIDKIINDINTKIEIYNNYIKSEKENKINSLDSDSKKKLLEKEKEKENNKVKRNIELAKKRIIVANEKISQLQNT